MIMGSNNTLLLLLSVVLAAFTCTAFGKPVKNSRLAKYTTLCKTNDPKFNGCITNAVKDILKYAKTGIPELNIPTFEPFVIPELDLKIFQGLEASLLGGKSQKSDKYKAIARNIVVHHSSEFDLHSLKTDMQKKQFFIDISFPKLQVEGEYDVNMELFNIPIKSKGPMFVNATDISAKATLNGKTIKRANGDTVLLFDSIDIKVDFKDYSALIEKLFKKDQNLNRALNDLIRNQKPELKKMAMPIIENMAGGMVLDMINRILSSVSMEELFITE